MAQYGPTDSTYSPHNSSLTMAIRTGIPGGLAYPTLVVGSLLDGVFPDDDSSVAVSVLALAVGYAATLTPEYPLRLGATGPGALPTEPCDTGSW